MFGYVFPTYLYGDCKPIEYFKLSKQFVRIIDQGNVGGMSIASLRNCHFESHNVTVISTIV